MTPTELAADFVSRNVELLKMTVSDFSDQDFLTRPVPGANHAAWQVGHLVGSAHHMVGAVAPGVIPDAFASYGEKYSGKTAGSDDPKQFGSRAELLEAFAQAYAAVVNWATHLTPEEMNKPTPGGMAQFAPTVGHLVLMNGAHISMHLGQLQVLRRKLGKPLLF